MANGKRKHTTFETDYPAVDDFDYRNDCHTNLVCTRQKEMFTAKGIRKDYLDELEVYDDNPGQSTYVKVKTGTAYVQGERSEVESVQTVNLSAGIQTEDDVIWIKHDVVQNSDPDAERDDELGSPHTVWWDDSYELGATPLSSWTDPDDKLKLAQVHWNGAALEITLNEVYVKLEAPIGDGVVDEDAIAVGAVTSTKIANWAVSENKITPGAVTSGKLGTAAVTADKIQNAAVDENKLAADAVTQEKIADEAVGTEELVDEAVVTNKLGPTAVTTAKIADGAVTAAKIGTGAVAEAKLEDGAVTAAKISSGAVVTTKLDNEAVSHAKLGEDTDLISIYDAREEKRGVAAQGEDIDPLTVPVSAALFSVAGTTKYKVVTWFMRVAIAGPISKLHMDYYYEVTGTPSPEMTVYLVAWPTGNPPPVSDPDNGSFTGLKDSNVHSGAGTGTASLEIDEADFSSISDTGRWLVGIVMKLNSDCTADTKVADMYIVGQRGSTVG